MTSTIPTSDVQTSTGMVSDEGEYLTFLLGSEEYGIQIMNVQEIRGYEAVTQIPNTPSFIKGVINLRGRIVPIIDLRIKFKLNDVRYNELTVVIVMNLNGRIVGVVVDAVSDVIALKTSQIEPMPALDTSIDTKYIIGLATYEERMLVLVAIEQLMTSQEMGLTDELSV
ncbi:chemotaxis protein CheW [Methylotenera mobilis]|uniref:Chemotaxis protein CheW n=1 Tax=Methylotenera mobilis (strain JLW8 / ATCC BAA-1282 / DSM 17540) TaxID=583345 RepID=C6WUX6_METML|nr:chemotaxis protein CheW [Methylotenera mobilis]ACT47725.1 CheW protein [Methylotenera mobilis JLW8]